MNNPDPDPPLIGNGGDQTEYPTAVDQDMEINERTEKDEETADQMSFVRKVLGIVGFQLVITFAICIYASVSIDFGIFCISPGVQITSFFVYIASFIALFCSRGLRFAVPLNYIALTIFTISMAFMVASLTAWLTYESVLLSIGVLALVLTCLWTAMLATPNPEKVIMGMLIGLLGAILFMFVITIPLCIMGFFGGLCILWCFLGVLMSSALIYIDLFLIMIAGKVAKDEYILCALKLYIDIIRLLIYLLLIFGGGKK